MVFLAYALMLSLPVFAQLSGKDVEVDYNNPKKYVVGGVRVEGNN